MPTAAELVPAGRPGYEGGGPEERSDEQRGVAPGLGGVSSVDEPLEQPAVLAEVPVDQKMPPNALAGLLPETPGLLLVGQGLPHEPAEGRQIARVAEQEAARAILDLLQHAADGAGDHRTRLPHRFG